MSHSLEDFLKTIKEYNDDIARAEMKSIRPVGSYCDLKAARDRYIAAHSERVLIEVVKELLELKKSLQQHEKARYAHT